MSDSVWFHGSACRIARFADDFIGTGNDEQGPGVYFTDSRSTSEGYARKCDSGHVIEVAINGDLLPDSFQPSATMVGDLMRASPGYEDALANFGDIGYEGREKVHRRAVATYARLPLRECVLSLSNDFWDGHEREMIKVMARAFKAPGYVRQVGDERHAIVWDLGAIEILRAIPTASGGEPTAVHPADDGTADILRRIASDVREGLEAHHDPDGERPFWSVGRCLSATKELVARLRDHGFDAKPVHGTYTECRPDYPDIVHMHGADGLSEFDPDEFDGLWTHWWAECCGYVVDVTADQFRAEDRGDFAVVVAPKGDLAYGGQEDAAEKAARQPSF